MRLIHRGLLNFYMLKKGPSRTKPGENNDLFISSATVLTLTLENDAKIFYRDVVIWGTLIIQSSDPASINRPKITARDVFLAGECYVDNVNIELDNFVQAVNVDSLRERLQNVLPSDEE